MTHDVSEPDPRTGEPLAVEGGRAQFAGQEWPWPPADAQIGLQLQRLWQRGDWGRYTAPVLEQLREELCRRFERKHAWLCSSGTVAVELALRGLGIKPGEEVLLAGYDFPGNFRAVEALGARPVLLDLAPGTWHLDVEAIPRACSPQTRAVVVSHLHGTLAPMAQIVELASRLGLQVVEDACQCPGATIDGKAAGSWGDASVLSFGGSKLLTAGRGGAVLTDRPEVLQRIKVFAGRGNDAFPLSTLQAAVLLPQLEQMAARHQQRLQAAERLHRLLQGAPGVRLGPWPPRPGSSPAFYKLGLLLPEAVEQPRLRACWLQAAQAEGLPLGEGFRGFATRGARRCRRVGSLPQARLAAAATLLVDQGLLLAPAQVVEAAGRRLVQIAHWAARAAAG